MCMMLTHSSQLLPSWANLPVLVSKLVAMARIAMTIVKSSVLTPGLLKVK
jgi:hypothetical protein